MSLNTETQITHTTLFLSEEIKTNIYIYCIYINTHTIDVQCKLTKLTYN